MVLIEKSEVVPLPKCLETTDILKAGSVSIGNASFPPLVHGLPHVSTKDRQP